MTKVTKPNADARGRAV